MHGLLRRCGCGERAGGGAVLAVAGEGVDGAVATVVGETAWLFGWIVSCCEWEHLWTVGGRCVELWSAIRHRLPQGGCTRCSDWCVVVRHRCNLASWGRMVSRYSGTSRQ